MLLKLPQTSLVSRAVLLRSAVTVLSTARTGHVLTAGELG
jgi:hypothetical protein